MAEYTDQELEAIIDRRIHDILGKMLGQHSHIFEKNIQILDGRTIQVGKNRGLTIGTNPDQKLSLWGAAPVTQQPSIAAVPVTNVTDAAVNSLITTLRNVGILP